MHERIQLALREGRRKDAAAMATAWLEVAVRAPSIYGARQALRQWHVVPDENLFRAAATGPPLLDGSLPRVDGPAIRGHYLHLESALRVER